MGLYTDFINEHNLFSFESINSFMENMLEDASTLNQDLTKTYLTLIVAANFVLDSLEDYNSDLFRMADLIQKVTYKLDFKKVIENLDSDIYKLYTFDCNFDKKIEYCELLDDEIGLELNEELVVQYNRTDMRSNAGDNTVEESNPVVELDFVEGNSIFVTERIRDFTLMKYLSNIMFFSEMTESEKFLNPQLGSYLRLLNTTVHHPLHNAMQRIKEINHTRCRLFDIHRNPYISMIPFAIKYESFVPNIVVCKEYYPELLIGKLSERYQEIRDHIKNLKPGTQEDEPENFSSVKKVIDRIKSRKITKIFRIDSFVTIPEEIISNMICASVKRLKKYREHTMVGIDTIFIFITRVLELLSQCVKYVPDKVEKNLDDLIRCISSTKLLIEFNSDLLEEHLSSATHFIPLFHNVPLDSFLKKIEAIEILRRRVAGIDIPMVSDDSSRFTYLLDVFRPGCLSKNSLCLWRAKFDAYPSLQSAIAAYDDECAVCLQNLTEVPDVVILSGCDHVCCVTCSQSIFETRDGR